MDIEPQADLNRSLQELFSSGKYSDCTITCGVDEYRVHKAIICPRSSFFDAAFTHDMKEKATGTVSLDDDDPEAVRSMLHYLYHLDYSAPPRCGTIGGSVGVETPTQKRVKFKSTGSVWELWGVTEAISEDIPAAEPEPAPEPVSESVGEPPPEPPELVQEDGPAPALEPVEGERAEPPEPPPVYRRKKKLLPRCKTCAKRKCICAPNLIHHSRVYAIAEKYAISSLKSLAAKKFKLECEVWWNHREFIHAAREAYSSTLDHDRGLRDVVVQTIREHRGLLDSGEVKSVLRETLLAYDLVMAFYL